MVGGHDQETPLPERIEAGVQYQFGPLRRGFQALKMFVECHVFPVPDQEGLVNAERADHSRGVDGKRSFASIDKATVVDDFGVDCHGILDSGCYD